MYSKSIQFRITGESPLIMHNGRLADPLDEYSKRIKRISGKRIKTDDDHAEMARLEFLGSLYLSGGEPCIPGEHVEAMLINAGKKHKKGGAVMAGVLVTENAPLEYYGPRDPDALWSDGRFRFTIGARIKNVRVMRTRPRFDGWVATVTVLFDPSMMNESEVIDLMKYAGESIGIMDWRPKFGRFQAEVV